MIQTIIYTILSLLAGRILLSRISYIIAARKAYRATRALPPYNCQRDLTGIYNFYTMLGALRNDTAMDVLAEAYAKNGPTFGRPILGRTNVQTMDPENIKTILSTKFADFDLGRRHDAFFPTLGDGIFTLDGEGWSHSRALLRPQFSRAQVSDVVKLERHVSNLLAAIPRGPGQSCEIQELLYKMTMDSATEFLFGESVDSLVLGNDEKTGASSIASDGGRRGFAAAFNIAQEYLSKRVIFQSLYWVINNSEFREANRVVHSFVDFYVAKALEHYDKKVKEPAATEKQGPERYVFLDALAEETQDPRVLRDQLLNILLAGRDTTAGTLTWAFYELARHPRVLDKLRHEVLDRFGDRPGAEGKLPMNFETLKGSLYLRYVVNEVLRLYPSVPQNFRIANKDTVLPRGGGKDRSAPVFIRKGQGVFYLVYSMHRRPDFFGDDADEFRPERWGEGKTWQWEYLPFNGGPRICLGQQYALTEAAYTLARVVQEFDTIETTDVPQANGKPLKRALLTMSSAAGVHVSCYKK
ncbi:cytochrome P450 [Kockiozyma suomiensis]|uniref:cytochrome P450 n=1 Tax=Kockiozyma suomiensis TaxID=1337062 RepID=UPI003343797B